MPLQDAHIRRKAFEEAIRRAFRGQMHGGIANLLRWLRVSCVWIHACVERMSDQLASKADPQHRDGAYGALDERHLVILGRIVFVDSHWTAHHDERSNGSLRRLS